MKRTSNSNLLEKKIESKLREALGYDVATFIRTDAELKAVANYKPFSQSQLDAATAFNVAFLKEPLDDQVKAKSDGLEDGY